MDAIPFSGAVVLEEENLAALKIFIRRCDLILSHESRLVS